MIITNGTIELLTKTGGGIDPTSGYPLATTETWGAPVPCQYVASRCNLQGRTSQGESYTAASYTILVEEQPIAGEQLRLKDADGTAIGEYSIIQVERLSAVGQTRITV